MLLFGNAPVVQQDVLHSPGEPCTSNSLLYDIVEWVAVSVLLFTNFIAMVILVPIGMVKPYKGNHGNEARRKVPPVKPRLPIVDSAKGSVSRNDVTKTEGGNEVDSRPKEVSSSLEIPAVAGQSSSSCPPTTKTPSPPVKSDDESPYRSESPADATDGTDGSEEPVSEQSSGIPAEEAQQDVLYYPWVRYALGSLLHDILEWVAVGTSVLTSLIALLLMVPTGKITLYGGDRRGNKAVPQQNQRTSCDTSSDELSETRLQAAVTSAGISASQANDIRTGERTEVDSRPTEGASTSSESSAESGHSYSSASLPPKETQSPPVRSDESPRRSESLADASQTACGSVTPLAAASQTAGGTVAPLAEGSHANSAEQDTCCCKPCEFCLPRIRVGYDCFLLPLGWLVLGCCISVLPTIMTFVGHYVNQDNGDWKVWVFFHTCSILYIFFSTLLLIKACKEWRIFMSKRQGENEIKTS